MPRPRRRRPSRSSRRSSRGLASAQGPGRDRRPCPPGAPEEVVDMQVARVVGNVVASVKEPRLTGTTLLLVEDAATDGASLGRPAYVAVDLVGAGETELVVVVTGSPAARAIGVEGTP